MTQALWTRRSVLAAGAALAAAPAFAAATTARVRRLDPALDRIVAPDAEVEVIATGIRWAEGPVWVPKLGGLLFSDPPANIMRLWTRAGGVSVFLQPSGAAGTDLKLVREAGSNGLGLDHQAHLLIANSGGRSIDQLDLRTRKRKVIAGTYNGKRFNSCNDLTVSRDGAIYFTDPPYGFADGDSSPLKEVGQNGVYRWTFEGGVVLIEGGLTRPNGIALSPDERRLFVSVSDEKAPVIMVYDLDKGGIPNGPGRVWLDAAAMQRSGGPGLPDGMKIAADGTMFCSAPGGMYVLTPDAKPLGLIEDGQAIANCCFGEDGRTLFMASSDRILRLPLRIDGFRARA